MLASLPIILGFFTLLWIFSLWLKDASIVDRFWGLGFLLLYALRFFDAEFSTVRGDIVFILVSIWAIRLSGYIHFRNTGHGEDVRYQKMRHQHGRQFWWKSWFTVFLLQGTLLWIISAPLLWVLLAPQANHLNWLDAVAISVWTIGFLFEAVADFQMARFKANPSNRAKVCNTGLWGMSRHPNYFGEALIWWAFYLIACSTEHGAATIFSPILMTVLLLRVSGVSLLERQLSQSKPGYQNYIREVPSFIPTLWPRRWSRSKR